MVFNGFSAQALLIKWIGADTDCLQEIQFVLLKVSLLCLNATNVVVAVANLCIVLFFLMLLDIFASLLSFRDEKISDLTVAQDSSIVITHQHCCSCSIQCLNELIGWAIELSDLFEPWISLVLVHHIELDLHMIAFVRTVPPSWAFEMLKRFICSIVHLIFVVALLVVLLHLSHHMMLLREKFNLLA